MNWWQSVTLGLVQGFTEFLPVSSSGHLVLAEELIGFHSPGVFVEVILHLATLVAVLIVYRRKLLELVAGVFRRDRDSLRYVLALVVATIPAVIVGFTLKDAIESSFDSLLMVGVDLMLTGTILWSTRWIAPTTGGISGTRNPVLIGLAQAFAILPGVSRSGSTISAAMWLKISPEKAAEFSFIMAIPVIAGAAVLQLGNVSATGASIGWGPLFLAAGTALVSGIAAIVFLVELLKKGAFHRFAPYCWVLGISIVVWQVV